MCEPEVGAFFDRWLGKNGRFATFITFMAPIPSHLSLVHFPLEGRGIFSRSKAL